MGEEALRIRAAENLAWARDQVVELLADLVVPGEEPERRLLDQLTALSCSTNDPGRRLALLVQLGALLVGAFETVGRADCLDRVGFALELVSRLDATLPLED